MATDIISTDQVSFWMNGAGSKRVLSRDEVLVIARKIQSNPVGSPARKKAVNKLVIHNLRLVIRYVNAFMQTKTRKNWGDTETLDFLQVGAMALIRAAEKYDPTMGYAFGTYANYWIRSFVNRYSIKISSVFNISESACRDAYSFDKYGFIKDKSYEEAKMFCESVRAAQSAMSLDAPIGANGNVSLGDILESTYLTDTFVYDCFPEDITNLMKRAKLTQDQIKILHHYFVDELNIRQITEKTDFSHNQVCFLKRTALEKMKTVLESV
jgi:RNA polymerase sigma factor (sigma-70 family)